MVASNELARTSLKSIRNGLILAAIGVAITAVTYTMASDGGTYFVAFGPVILGAITFAKGVFGLLRAVVSGS